MDPYVATPHWGVWITAYFYLGGIAAGAYAAQMLAGLFGTEDDARVSRVASYLAFPIVNVCGLILVVDLNRPERFWHMLVQSQTFRPMFKWWSPMSAGSWGLSAFGAFSFVSFLGVLAEDGRFGLGRWSGPAVRLRRGKTGAAFQVGGVLSALFLGAYTGALLSATNQPIWADSTWISALFLASAFSTGVAAIVLVALTWLPDAPHAAVAKLERLDRLAAGLELALLLAFAASVWPYAAKALGTYPGVLVPAVVLPFGIAAPLAAGRLPGRGFAIASSVAVLGAGLALRYAVIGMPSTFLVGL